MIPPAFRKGVQSLVGAGERPVKAAVTKAAESANTARESALTANKAVDEKTLAERGKVDIHNASLGDADQEAARVNTQLARRSAAEKELRTTSENLDVAVEKARHDALAIGNQKYNGVNESLSHLTADPEAVNEALGNASESLRGSTQDTALLKNMEKEYREDVPTYSDLQGDYSRLGRELTKGTLPGDIFHAYSQLHEAIGDEMQRIADSQGIGGQLQDARAYWRRMKQTFGKSSDTISNRAAKAVQTANPKLLRSQANEYQIRLLASFDPEIANLANRADELKQELTTLPKKASEAASGARTEYAEPHATRPVERPEVSTQKIREDLVDKWASNESVANKWQVRSLVSGGLGALIGLATGEGRTGAEIGGTLGAAFGPAVVANLLERPGMRAWITKPPPGELAALERLPNADRIKITDGLSKVVQAAQSKGIKVSPALLAAIGAGAATRPQHPTLSPASPIQ